VLCCGVVVVLGKGTAHVPPMDMDWALSALVLSKGWINKRVSKYQHVSPGISVTCI
jgi:hypothetical protein